MDDMLRTPPHSIEAEQSVLGSLMINAGAWDLISDEVTEADFYRRDHRLIFSAIAQLVEMREPIDAITVIDRLRDREELEAAGAGQYVASLPKQTPTSANVRAYAGIIRTKAQERRLMNAGAEIGSLAFEDLSIEEKVDRAGQLVSGIGGVMHSVRGMTDILREAVDALDQRYNSGELTGLPTGLIDLDKRLNGLQDSDLIIVAGRPGMGKTTFAMNIAEHNAIAGIPVAVFSMEMPDRQLIDRAICSTGRVGFDRYKSGDLSDEDWPRVSSAVGKLQNAKLFIDDTPALSVEQLRNRARKLTREHGIKLIVVDYLQLMRAKGENRTNEISAISRGLKALAKELNMPVIALSQLNRGVESRPDKRPHMSDLRESGSIEQDADIVMFLYRDEVYDENTHMRGIAEVLIRKFRNGQQGTIYTTFLGNHCRFEAFTGPLPKPDNARGFKYEG